MQNNASPPPWPQRFTSIWRRFGPSADLNFGDDSPAELMPLTGTSGLYNAHSGALLPGVGSLVGGLGMGGGLGGLGAAGMGYGGSGGGVQAANSGGEPPPRRGAGGRPPRGGRTPGRGRGDRKSVV